MITPDLGPPLHNLRCGHTDDPRTPACNQPPTWHIAWQQTSEGTQASYACDPHMTAIQTRYAYLDRHPIGDDCTSPDARWVDSRIDARCITSKSAARLGYLSDNGS